MQNELPEKKDLGGQCLLDKDSRALDSPLGRHLPTRH
jgi:hypothetical protein